MDYMALYFILRVDIFLVASGFTGGEVHEFNPFKRLFIFLVLVEGLVALVAHVGILLQHTHDQGVAAIQRLLVRVPEGFLHVDEKHETAYRVVQLSRFLRAAMISASLNGLMFFNVMIDLQKEL